MSEQEPKSAARSAQSPEAGKRRITVRQSQVRAERGADGRARVSVVATEASLIISAAAELTGMHPQTLRQYDRLGLVIPARTGGGGRRYSESDIEALRTIQQLSQEEGVSLAGIKRILELENQVRALSARVLELVAELEARDRQ